MNKISPPYKLVLVLQDLEFGGTQRYAVNLLQHLDRSLFDPELWVLRGGMDMLPLVEKTGTRVKWFSRSSWVTPLALYRFMKYLACNKPMYLYSLTVVPNIWSRIFGSLLRIPVIITSYRTMHAQQWEWLLRSLSTHIICNAAAIREKVIECHKVDVQQISVIANGVDVDWFYPSPAGKSIFPTLYYSSRLHPIKDPFMVLKAFQVVLHTVPAAKMVMTGNGKMLPSLKQFIREHALEKSVTLLPGTVDVRKYLQQSWVFLMSSLSEGSPNSIIEAMACETPVVATRVGGIPELVEHGVNGYLVAVGDYEKFAEFILKLLVDEKLRITIARNARESVLKNNNIHNSVRLTERLLLNQLVENADVLGKKRI